MGVPTDDDWRRAVERLPAHPHLAGIVAQAIADERERCAKAAVEARDWLMKGCRSNGAWLGYEMMKAHDVLVKAVGDGRSEADAPPERQCVGCDCLYVGDGYGDGWCSHLCAHTTGGPIR